MPWKVAITIPDGSNHGNRDNNVKFIDEDLKLMRGEWPRFACLERLRASRQACTGNKPKRHCEDKQ